MDVQCKNSTSLIKEDKSSCSIQLRLKYSGCVFLCVKNFSGCNYFGLCNSLLKKRKIKQVRVGMCMKKESLIFKIWRDGTTTEIPYI